MYSHCCEPGLIDLFMRHTFHAIEAVRCNNSEATYGKIEWRLEVVFHETTCERNSCLEGPVRFELQSLLSEGYCHLTPILFVQWVRTERRGDGIAFANGTGVMG